jgi:hypothetical protein
MADIGATLREARMRAKIDVSEVEADTKIRAKYLRALENEEWGLLPGSTYVKTFLRTYADYLGLDSKLLIEEYKLRYEPVSSADVPALGGGQFGGRRERIRPPSGPSRMGVAIGAVASLVILLAIIGLLTNGGKKNKPAATPTNTTAAKKAPATPAAKPKPRQVRLQIVPTGPVYVCLLNSNGTKLVGGRILQPGARLPTFRSRRFRMTLGNGQVRLRVNGRERSVPATSGGIGYELTPAKGRVVLPPGRRPTCA